MGNRKQFPNGKGVPPVEGDGFTKPAGGLAGLHTERFEGHPIHPARLPNKPKRF